MFGINHVWNILLKRVYIRICLLYLHQWNSVPSLLIFLLHRPVSAYALFFRDTQAAIKGGNPSASFGEVSKIVASMWDSLDPDTKNVSNLHVCKFTSNLMGKEFLNHSWSKDFITKTSLRELNYKNPYGHKSLILNFGKFIFKCLIMKEWYFKNNK